MKQPSREHAAIHSFQTAANNFRPIIGFEADDALASFYDVYVGAISNFMLCELNTRQAERCLAAGIQTGRAADLREAASRFNDLGIAALKGSLPYIADLEKRYGTKLGVEHSKEFVKLVDDFHRDLMMMLVDIEIKASDLLELSKAFQECRAAAKKGSAAVCKKLREDTIKFYELRESKDRGAATNIPGWKIAGIILMIGVSYVTYVRCIQQQNCTRQQIAFLVAAGLTGTILTNACE